MSICSYFRFDTFGEIFDFDTFKNDTFESVWVYRHAHVSSLHMTFLSVTEYLQRFPATKQQRLGYILKFTYNYDNTDMVVWTSVSSIDKCQNRCWNNENCCVFEYSKRDLRCQLHPNCIPRLYWPQNGEDYDPSKSKDDYVLYQKSKHII